MTEAAFFQAALAIALGMAVQVFATRFAVPSIVLLLIVGVAAGPSVGGILDPRVFGVAIRDLVTFAVTVILFEGGLALRLEDLRQQQRSLTFLLTLGAAISMIGGTVAARYALGMTWSIAALYGALVIVTGPTVVTPLLSRLSVERTVRDLLISEGVLIDPIGAVVAIVLAEWIVGRSAALEAGWLIFVRLSVGAAMGAAAGGLLAGALQRRWIPDDLRNPAVLGAVLLVAALASRVSSEAGLMAAVAQGVVMANFGLRELNRLRQFKEELTTLLLSFIFVVLAADLSPMALRDLGWHALLVVALLAWVARPTAVFVCTIGSGLTLRQRLFVSWICPRGIVAASVAGLFGILLSNAHVAGGEQLEALVFMTVGLTVAVQGLTAGPIARLLRVDLPTLQGTIIVGADYLGRLLARLLLAHQRQVVLMDSNVQHCRIARAAGLSVYHGDALSVDALEEAGARYADSILAMTPNQELNTLIAQRVRGNFRVERILAVGNGAGGEGAPRPFPGLLSGIDQVNQQLFIGRTRVLEYEVRGDAWVGRKLTDLTYGSGEFALLLERREHLFLADTDQILAIGDRLACLKPADAVSPLASIFTVLSDIDARELLASHPETSRSHGS